MKTSTLLVLPIAALLSARPARADDPEQAIGQLYDTGIAIGAASLVLVEGTMLWHDHELAREGRTPSLARSSRELAINHLAMSVGATLMAFGLEEHVDMFALGGGALIATSIPGAVHGLWGLGTEGDGATDDERRADRHDEGVTEVAFGVPELAIETLAFTMAARDPVDSVRSTGMATAALLAVPSAALAIHGIYVLSTPELIAHAQPRGVMIVPTVVGGASDPTLGVGALGRF